MADVGSTSISTKLRISLYVVSALLVLSTVLAVFYANAALKQFNQLTNNTLPRLERTTSVGRDVALLTSMLSSIEQNRTPEDIARRRAEILDLVDRLGQRSQVLQTSQDNVDQSSLIEDVLNDVKVITLRTLDAQQGVIEKTLMVRRSSEALDRIGQNILTVAGPMHTDAALEFAGALTQVTDINGGGQAEKLALEASSANLQNHSKLLIKLESIVYDAHRFTLDYATSPNQTLGLDLLGNVNSATRQLSTIPESPDRQVLSTQFSRFYAILSGKNGVLQLAADIAEESGSLADAKAELSLKAAEFSDVSARLIDQSIREVGDSEKHLAEIVWRFIMQNVLISFLALMLISIVVFVFVEKQIIRRIDKLTRSVRAIADGDINHVVAVSGNDELAEMAQSLEVFKDNARELQRSNEELQSFAYVAAHDLRSPLRSIHDLAEWTLEDAGDDMPAEAKKNLDLILVRTKRLSKLLSDLLEYARASAEEMTMAQVDVKKTVEEIAEIVNVDKHFSITIEGNAQLKTFATPFRTILLNVINNAIKHHDRPTGAIAISVASTNRSTAITIEDDGPGIEPSYHKKIFDLFTTLRRRDVVEGSGMGLAMVQKLVERLGGRISIRSNPEKKRGTAFILTLPRGEM